MLEPTALGTLQQGNKEETQAIKVDDYDTARTAVEDCLRRHVEERHETHAYLTWSKMWRQRTCQEQELRAQAYKRKGPSPPTLEEKYVQHVSPFAAMSPIQIPFDKKSTYPDISQAIFTKSKPKDTVIRSALVVPTTKYKSDAVNIPPFKEYVSLKHNILADNESKLLATPYFPDDEEEDSESRKELIKMLPKIYEMTHDQKGPLDLRKEQCKFYKDSIEAFLGEIGISWNDILYWLLGPEATIRLIVSTLPGSRQFEALYDDPHNHEDTFERDGETRDLPLFDSKSKKWQDFFLQLKEPTTTCLRLAAIACAVFFQECDFSIWYLARQSDLMQRHILRKTKDGQTVVKFTYRQAMCTVCHQHNCLLHGELREEPSESVPSRPKSPTRNHDNTEDEHTEEDDRLPAHHHDDSDFEKVINYKLPANPDAFNVRAESEAIPTKRPKPPNGKFNPSWWLQRIESQRWGNRKPFFPCNHDSSCEGAQCRCYMEGTTCEKTCKCSPVCNRRFPGCSCAAKSGKRVCISDKCFCMKFDRECDADLCGSCGATDILDPVNRYNEDVLAGRCGNVAIQRGVPRKTQLAHSRVHGFGLCMGEDIKIDEYIGEYTGETITISEGARRMEIYHHQKTMYLFTLNLKQEVDATYMGNKLRFINNADDKNSNCYPKNLLCNTVFRLALYAKVDIKAGAELYFNYNYPKELTETFKQPDGKTVAVKQTAKQKGKGKSSSSNEIQSVEDRPHTLASTAKTKARADRIEKRAAMQAKKSSQNSAPTLRPGPQRARKTAISEPDQQRVSQLLSRGIKSAPRTASRNQTSASEFGRDLEASNHDVPPVAVSQDTQATRSTQVVQDTDEEEDDLIPENNTQEDANEEDIPISDAAQDRGERRKAGILRRKQSDMAPVIRRKGGPRPRASRKRKRVVFDDSDED
ncbi:hypothetical protein EJ02DRAFT_346180 [Clathrospora elynae]|uniref:SET domain-containing protein n=1 Tax=Clathrospora elynae TaxID=706981 RepID=A0A6A5SRL0_9PLEO|nr:hypothetical protein EJ02DRAFT_346180 [Clathrospora elynae]